MKTIVYAKDQHYPGDVVIGKERSDIRNADSDDIIRVEYKDGHSPLEATFGDLVLADAPEAIANKYPDGAWMVSRKAFRVAA